MRHLFAFRLAAASAYLFSIAWGQQLGFQYPYETMTLSDSCLRMLDTNVTECSPGLFYHAPIPDLIFQVLVEEELVEICHQNCYDSLMELRPKIQAACNTDMDAVASLYEDTIFPPTYMVDLLLLSYKPLECEDCLLAPLKIELEAGISYKDGDASEFEDITSSCNATGYDYTKPTPYATTLPTEWWATMENSASITPTDSVSKNI
ncbi:domain-containing protein [Fusarium coicis]|nr:domain-containing protein [Fusarium coicis]